MDRHEVVKKVDSHLTAHPHATLQIAARMLETTEQIIEEALREVEGVSFQEFLANKRLEQAFKQLGEFNPAARGPYGTARARPRVIIPKTTVRYRIHSFWIRKSSYSNQCPLVDLSSDGLAFLADSAQSPGKRISLILKFPGGEETLRVEGRVVYALATGIAGYRYRIGTQFLPFAERRGCNSPKAHEILVNLEKTNAS
jgi:hypothetical protein